MPERINFDCTIPGCNKKAAVRRLCRAHYHEWRITSNPNHPKCKIYGCDKPVHTFKSMLCDAHRAKQWRADNPELALERGRQQTIKRKLLGKVYRPKQWKSPSAALQKAMHRRLREKIIRYYSCGTNKCMCKNCGVSDMEFLSIDHINGGGTNHLRQLKGQNLYYWLIKNKLPSGFRVLCYNCNFSLGHYGYCPHEVKCTATFNYRMRIYKPKR